MRMCFSEGRKKGKKEKTRTFHVDPDSIDTALHTLCSTISKCPFFFIRIIRRGIFYTTDQKRRERARERIEKKRREREQVSGEELPENSDARALPGDDNLLFAVGPPASIHTRWAVRYVHTPRLSKEEKKRTECNERESEPRVESTERG